MPRLMLMLMLMLMPRLMLMLSPRLMPMLMLMLMLTMDTEATMDMEATMEDTVTAEDTMASARLMPNPRLQLNLTTDTKNCGSEEPHFECIPTFPEAHELTTLRVLQKHSSPLRFVLSRTHIFETY